MTSISRDGASTPEPIKADIEPPIWTPSEGKALVLRTCASDGTSYHGTFTWPANGPVECPDWQATTSCGNGLHGALWGNGDGTLLNWDRSALWQVVEVDAATVIDLTGKVKFPAGVVVYTGDQEAAVALVARHAPDPSAVIANHSSTTGDYAHSSTTGDYAHSSTTGDYAHSSTTGADAHSSTTGADAHSSTTGADAHSSTTGARAHSSTTGARAHSSTTGADAHSSTTGARAVATALAPGATATAGENGTIVLAWKDPSGRLRITVGYPGENDVEAGAAYRCDQTGQLIKVDNAPTNRAATVVNDYEISTEQIQARNESFKVINLAAERAKRGITTEAQ